MQKKLHFQDISIWQDSHIFYHQHEMVQQSILFLLTTIMFLFLNQKNHNHKCPQIVVYLWVFYQKSPYNLGHDDAYNPLYSLQLHHFDSALHLLLFVLFQELYMLYQKSLLFPLQIPYHKFLLLTLEYIHLNNLLIFLLLLLKKQFFPNFLP